MSRRGVRIFDKLVESDLKQSKKTSKKGRSNRLIERRDNKLLHRMYYYSVIKKIRYAEVIDRLEEEFDITSYTIVDLISKKIEELQKIKKNAPTVVQLRRKFPMYTWS